MLFFSHLIIHGSGLNTSDQPRSTLLIQMRDPSDKPMGPQHLSRGQGMMLRGIEPGADADSYVGPSRDIYRSCVRNNGGLNGGQYLGVVY